MTVAARHVTDDQWNYKVLPTRVGWDSHNSIVMTMDKNRCLHVSGNMHNDTLIYFVNREPEDISSFERLSNKPLFDGLGKMSAYKSGPRLGPDGYFHTIWLWRDTPGCETNHDLSYARSKDLIHWQALEDEAIKVPITPEESRITVDPVPAGGGAINGNFRLFFDSENKPLITYMKYDKSGFSQVYLATPSNGKWVSKKISDWDYRLDFSGPGSITFDIRIGKARFNAEGDILISFSHIQEGDGEMLIDGRTLDLVKYRQLNRQVESRYPKTLREPHSDLEGMQVQWKNMGWGGEQTEGYYALRWETTGKRRFYEPPEIPVPPSPLTLYKLQNEQ